MVLDKTMGLRVTDEQEREGLDKVFHREMASFQGEDGTEAVVVTDGLGTEADVLEAGSAQAGAVKADSATSNSPRDGEVAAPTTT